MSLLSSSLLARAQRLIPPETVAWSKWLSNTDTTIGTVVPAYAAPVKIRANVQPVPKNRYEELGLDFQKTYVTVYCNTPLRDLQRDTACDLIDYGCTRYNVSSNTDWLDQNGWRGSVCVAVGATP